MVEERKEEKFNLSGWLACPIFGSVVIWTLIYFCYIQEEGLRTHRLSLNNHDNAIVTRFYTQLG